MIDSIQNDCGLLRPYVMFISMLCYANKQFMLYSWGPYPYAKAINAFSLCCSDRKLLTVPPVYTILDLTEVSKVIENISTATFLTPAGQTAAGLHRYLISVHCGRYTNAILQKALYCFGYRDLQQWTRSANRFTSCNGTFLLKAWKAASRPAGKLQLVWLFIGWRPRSQKFKSLTFSILYPSFRNHMQSLSDQALYWWRLMWSIILLSSYI